MTDKKQWPSQTKTFRDTLVLVREDAKPSDKQCASCVAPAEVIVHGFEYTSPDDGYEWEAYVCLSCYEEGLSQGEYVVGSVWTGTRWDAWENPLDFPEDYPELKKGE